MLREIRARYRRGMIEPLEDPGLAEGQEIVIAIKENTAGDADAALADAAGAWKDSMDFDAYLADLYRLRRDAGRRIDL